MSAPASSGMRAQLVNVQSNSEFASHQLNRDTWRDETLVSIIQGSFVFLQARSRMKGTAGCSRAAAVVCIPAGSLFSLSSATSHRTLALNAEPCGRSPTRRSRATRWPASTA